MMELRRAQDRGHADHGAAFLETWQHIPQQAGPRNPKHITDVCSLKRLDHIGKPTVSLRNARSETLTPLMAISNRRSPLASGSGSATTRRRHGWPDSPSRRRSP